MDVDVYLASLTQQLADAAALGGDEMVQLADRLAAPLQATARLVLLDVLSDAMQEVTLELAPGAAELRLRGRDISFVVTKPASPAGPVVTDDATMAPAPLLDDIQHLESATETGTARISFRPPDRLKAQIEAAAEREGLSVNAFLVRTLTAALRPAPPRGNQTGQRSSRGVGEKFEGWFA